MEKLPLDLVRVFSFRSTNTKKILFTRMLVEL